MTPTQMNAQRQLDALEEGQVTMLIQLMPSIYKEEIKATSFKKVFELTLVGLGWDQETIDYWSNYFDLTNYGNV